MRPLVTDLKVLFENEDWLAIDKPAGLPTLAQKPGGPILEGDHAISRLGDIRARLELGIENELGLVYRLDNGTSGLLLFAKHASSYARARELWGTPRVRKLYRAIVAPPWNLGQPTLVHPIGHSDKSAKRMIVVSTPAKARQIRGEARPAHTEIQRVVHAKIEGLEVSDLTIRIVTGVRHQIRAHLADTGHPILGDSVYHGAPSNRLWLHAWKVILPTSEDSGKELEIVAPLPNDWPSAT